MAVIGSLSVKLGLVTVEWDQATAKAKQQARDLQKAFNSLTGDVKTLYGHFQSLGGVIGLGGLGFAALTQQTLEFANATQDLAKGFDISVAKVLQFKDAIKTSGGNAEGAEKMLSSLFSKIQDAQSGNETAIAQFEQMGIGFQELIALKPEQAIDRIFNALNEGSKSTYQRVKMVKEMLGKQGVGLAIDEVAAKLNMSVEAYRKHEKAIKRLGDVSDSLKTSMDNLKLAFADVIAPLAGDGLISVEKFKAALYAIGSVYLIGQLMKVYEVFMLIRKALAANAALTASMTAMGGWKGAAAVAAGAAAFIGAQKLFGDEDLPTGSREASGRLERADGTSADDAEREKAMQANRRELTAAEAKVNLARQLTRIEKEQDELKVKSLFGDKYSNDLKMVELQMAAQLATIANARAQALNKENLSEDQKRLINADYDAQAAKARSKASSDKRMILEQDIAQMQIMEQQLETIKGSIVFDKESSALKLNAIGQDKKTAELLSLEFQTKQDIARIDAQEAANLLKINQTEMERLAIRTQAGFERKLANQRLVQGKELIEKTYQVELDAIQRIRQAQEEGFGFDQRAQILAQNSYKMRESDMRLAQEKIESERKIADLMRQQIEAQERMGNGELYEIEKRRIDDLIYAEGALSAARQQAIRDEEERRKSFTEGFEQAARQFATDAENYGRLGADLFNSAIGNMNSAIDNFVKTGKFSFKDFAQSIIQDTMAMILKFQAMQLVMMGLRALGFGGFGGSGGAPTMSAGTGGVSYAAAGGEIDRPTIVGENGPELFIPSRRGTVIPNMQASSFTGSQPQVVYNGPYIANMNAIDTQSGIQFLSKNKQAVWSANQSAQRSLPMSK
jgi:lambda family phage tail tape measure protein